MNIATRVKAALTAFAYEWSGEKYDALYLIPCQDSRDEPDDLRISLHVEVCEKVDDEHTQWRPIGGVRRPRAKQ